MQNIVEEINLPVPATPTLATALVECKYKNSKKSWGKNGRINFITDQHVEKRPYTLHTNRADSNTPYPKIGIHCCLFSTDERYIASKNGLKKKGYFFS
jgi:hypothetical protein